MSRSSPRIGIAVADFHKRLADALLTACCKELTLAGVSRTRVTTVVVPGAFELPLAAQRLARRNNIDAVICLGAVVRGQTFHYELVAREAARGIMDVSLQTGKPVIFEVLATDTLALAEARAVPGDRDNKGASAARTALAMLSAASGAARGRVRGRPAHA